MAFFISLKKLYYFLALQYLHLTMEPSLIYTCQKNLESRFWLKRNYYEKEATSLNYVKIRSIQSTREARIDKRLQKTKISRFFKNN